MKKKQILFVILLCFGCTQSRSGEIEDCLLWKISGNGLKNPSYLFGSMHTIRASFLDKIFGFNEAMKQIDQLIVETDVTAPARETAVKTDNSKWLMPSDTTYHMLYNAADFQLVDSVLKKMSNKDYSKYSPIFWETIYTISLYPSSWTVNPDEIMESFLIRTSKEKALSLISLDTDASAIAVKEIVNDLDGGGLQEQAENLFILLNNRDYFSYYMKTLDSLYIAQQLSKMPSQVIEDIVSRKYNLKIDSIQAKSMKLKVGQVQEKMIKKRNDYWIKKIPLLIHQKNSLIVVGVDHLLGKSGLISQLKSLGYAVTPVMDK